MLPQQIQAELRAHLEEVRQPHVADLAAGEGRVVLPEALMRKCPGAATEWRWQFVFPAGRICRDARWGPPSRYHLHESAIQRAVTEAARQAGLTKRLLFESLQFLSCAVVLCFDATAPARQGLCRSSERGHR
jgi:hypothetical protein